MSTNPTNFRYPPNIEGKADPQVVQTIQDHDDAILDLQNAIPELKSQITALQKTSTVSTTSTTNSTASSSVTPQQAAAIATTQIQATLGKPNDQTGTSYTALNSDYGGIVTYDNAGAVTVMLSYSGTGISQQWWTFMQNNGVGTVTIAPDTGTINGTASIDLLTGQSAAVFADGPNWAAATSIAGGGSGVTQIVAGANVTVSPGGGTGVVTVNATGTAYTVALIGGVLPPGTGTDGVTAHTAPVTAVLMASLYDPTSPAANEFLVAFAYNQNGTVAWSIFNVSSGSVTLLSSTVLNIRVFD